MPRIARAIAVGYPHHITQRGNHRGVVFFDDEDRRTHLTLLERFSNMHGLQIMAYCLMDDHFHLLAIPESESSLSKAVGLTNQVYTRYLD
ncbi:MAG: transposase [Deltaproteobacteria bacterium]|nr:transposase [Deltaproteobacteria bacterium]